MRIVLLVLLILLFSPSPLFAEYRVYKLKLTDTKTNKSREFLSTMMPEQYVFYYPISPFQTLQILDHWMCWARGDGFKKLCTRPFSDEGSK